MLRRTRAALACAALLYVLHLVTLVLSTHPRRTPSPVDSMAQHTVGQQEAAASEE